MSKRTPPLEKAQEIVKYFLHEDVHYKYLRAVFKELRQLLDVPVKPEPKKLPYVPSEEALKKYYDAVWKTQHSLQDVIIVKVLLYTGIRVSELIRLKIEDVDLENYQIEIVLEKGKKSRRVPFPKSFRETLALHLSKRRETGGCSLFQSSWKRPYSDRGVRKMLEKYSRAAGLPETLSPRRLRHFLFTWLKKQNIENEVIQTYSGHEMSQSLDVYSKVSLSQAQDIYDENIKNFPI